MKKLVCSVSMVLFVGTLILLTGCEKKSTVAIKNEFPQSFVDVKGELHSNGRFDINEVIFIDEVKEDSVKINLKGQMVERNLLYEVLLCGYSIDYKVYNSNGEEIEPNSSDKSHTINFSCNLQGVIDCTAEIYLGSEPDDYIIEFVDSNNERVSGDY